MAAVIVLLTQQKKIQKTLDGALFVEKCSLVEVLV